MNRWLVGLVMVGSWVVGACGDGEGTTVGESGDPTTASSNTMTTTVGESTLGESTLGESTLGESTLGETTVGETTVAESTLGETTVGESTTGEPQTCGEAQTEAQCNAVANEVEECAWLPSTVVAGGDACEEIDDPEFVGECVVSIQSDSCGPPSSPTCPDQTTMVYYRLLGLEIGAVELISFEADTLCEGPGDGFELCGYVEGDPATYDPPECACACPA